MSEDFETPQTPREFALMDRIRVLERALKENGHIDMINSYRADEMPSIHLPPDHPELLRVASLKASNQLGTWRVMGRAYTEEPGEYYEFTQYIERPEQHGFSSTTALTKIHQDFISNLGSYLTNRFGDIWVKYDKEAS